MAGVPPIQWGIVQSVDPQNQQVNVILRSGQIPPPVQVGTQGPNDALRVRQAPMPTRGTRVLIAYPSDDLRNGVIICSLPASMQNAFTSAQNDPHVEYEAHWSGYVSYRDQTGSSFQRYPDGSTIVMGAVSGVPTLYRNIITSGQQQVRQPVTPAQQVSGSVAPFVVAMNLANGVKVGIDGTGAMSLEIPAGQSFNLTVGGAGTAVITAQTVNLISNNVNLGGTGGKKVVLDGDPVIGGGGGTVQASSTKVKAV